MPLLAEQLPAPQERELKGVQLDPVLRNMNLVDTIVPFLEHYF
jgi:hypothetical protein